MVQKYFKAKFTLGLLVSMLLGASSSFGQFTTPTIDGTIGASEYGSSHSLTVDSRVWNLTWDDSNLYIGVSGHTNFGDAIVIYIDVDNLSPINSGSNSNGTASGTGYDGVTPNFPFRADFFAFIKDSYDDYKTDDGAGSWGASTTGSLTKSFSDANDVGEFAIPWSAITGSGRPSAFNFVGFMSYSGGGGGMADTKQRTKVPGTGRIRDLEVSPRGSRAWRRSGRDVARRRNRATVRPSRRPLHPKA
mgnify:CR=1 FL=1